MKCNYKIGGRSVPFKRVENAIRAVATETNLEDGLEKGYEFMPQKDVTFKQWKKFFNEFVEKQRLLKDTQVTAEQAVTEDTNSRTAKKLVEYLNLDKYIYTVNGKRYYSLAASTVDFIKAKKKKILEEGAISIEEATSLLNIIENITDQDAVVNEIQKNKKTIVNKIDSKLGDKVTMKTLLKRIFKLHPSLIREAGRLGELKTLYDMLNQRSIVLELGDINLMQEMIDEIIEGVNNKFEGDVKAKEVKEDNPKEKERRINDILDSDLNIDALEEYSYEYVYEAKKYITKEGLGELTNKELRTLQLALGNINRGILPFVGKDVLQKLMSRNEKNILTKTIQKLNPNKVLTGNFGTRSTRAAVRNWRGDKFEANFYTELLRSLGNQHVDTLLSNVKNTAIYDTLFAGLVKAATAVTNMVDSTYKEGNTIQVLIQEKMIAEHGLRTWRKHYQTEMAKIKLYQIKVEEESTPGLTPAEHILSSTIRYGSNKRLLNAELDVLQKIQDVYQEDGVINTQKLYDSLTDEGKQAVEFNINHAANNIEGIGFTSGVVRNVSTKIHSQYTHHSYVGDKIGEDSLSKLIGNNIGNTTKSGLLQMRKQASGTNPVLNFFNPIEDTVKAVKLTSLDANMSPAIQKTRATLKLLMDDIIDNPSKYTEEQKKVVKALNSVVLEKVDWYIDSKTQGPVRHWLETKFKSGIYTLKLFSVERVPAEWVSNSLFVAVADPIAAKIGQKIMRDTTKEEQYMFAKRFKTSHTKRLFVDNTWHREMQAEMLEESNIGERSLSKNVLTQNLAYVNDVITHTAPIKKTKEFIETAEEFTMSRADVVAGRVSLLGKSAKLFKEITGEDLDIVKYGMDDAYYNKHREVMEGIHTQVEQYITKVGVAQNEFLSIQNIQSKRGDMWLNLWRDFDGFFATYARNEYATQLVNIIKLKENGVLNEPEARRELGAAVLRKLSYAMVILIAKELLYEDDDEEDDGYGSALLYEIITSLVQLFVLRDQGAGEQIITTNLIEYLNEKVHEIMGLEYDWDQQITFRKINSGDFSRGSANGIAALNPLFDTVTTEADRTKNLPPVLATLRGVLVAGTASKKIPFGTSILRYFDSLVRVNKESSKKKKGVTPVAGGTGSSEDGPLDTFIKDELKKKKKKKTKKVTPTI